MYLLRAKITPMNAYGSVSRVSESIYKLLRYMNWWGSKDLKDLTSRTSRTTTRNQ